MNKVLNMNKLLLTAAITLMGIDSPVVAQEENGPKHKLLEEITVTATKRKDPENVQTVPLSVTAFNSSTLDALKIKNLQDLTLNAPNVSLDSAGSFRGFANFSIRGLGVTSSIPSIDPSVGVFVDGVYLGLNTAVVFDAFDIDSIELLRGPQGLLFGRNTTGGAVVLNTTNPSDELSVKFKANFEAPSGSEFGGATERIQGIISGPLVDGKLNGKIGAYYENDNGFFVNQFDGEDIGAAETVLLRGALEYFPSDSVTFLGKVEYMDSDGEGPGITNAGLFERGSFDVNVDNPGFQETTAFAATLRTDINVAFGNGVITNIFGYREVEQLANTDIDATPNQIFDVGVFTDQSQVSNELRYTGSFDNLTLTAGGYYFEQELNYDENRTLFNGAVRTAGGGKQDHLVLGAFANADWNLNDKLTFTAGVRYSYERKDAEISLIDGGGNANGVFCSVVNATCDTDFAEEPTFSNFTPRFALQYYPIEAMQLYTSYSRGFRSGVFNFRSTSAAPLLFQQQTTGSVGTEPESLDAFEVGLKYKTANGRGIFNIAGFHTAIDDLIRDVSVFDPVQGVLQFTANAGDAELYGIEIESTYAISDNLLIQASIGYLGNEYESIRSDLTNDGVIDEDDFALELTRAPRNSFRLGIVHNLDLGSNGSIETTASYARRSRIALDDGNLGFDREQDQANIDLTWRSSNERISVSLYGKNLFNEQSVGIDTQLPPVFGVGPFSDGNSVPFTAPNAGSFGTLKNGRTIGIEFKYEQ